jgi:hypothetical protein
VPEGDPVLLAEVRTMAPVAPGASTPGLVFEVEPPARHGSLTLQVISEQADCNTENDALVLLDPCGD